MSNAARQPPAKSLLVEIDQVVGGLLTHSSETIEAARRASFGPRFGGILPASLNPAPLLHPEQDLCDGTAAEARLAHDTEAVPVRLGGIGQEEADDHQEGLRHLPWPPLLGCHVAMVSHI